MSSAYKKVMETYGLLGEEEDNAAESESEHRKSIHIQLALMAKGLGYDLSDTEDLNRFASDVKLAVTTQKQMLARFAEKTVGAKAKKAVTQLRKSI